MVTWVNQKLNYQLSLQFRFWRPSEKLLVNCIQELDFINLIFKLNRSVGHLFAHLSDQSGEINFLHESFEGTLVRELGKTTKRNCYSSVRFIDGDDEKPKDFPWNWECLCSTFSLGKLNNLQNKWFEQIFRHDITHSAAGKIGQQPTVSILKGKYCTVDLLLTLISFYVL